MRIIAITNYKIPEFHLCSFKMWNSKHCQVVHSPYISVHYTVVLYINQIVQRPYICVYYMVVLYIKQFLQCTQSVYQCSLHGRTVHKPAFTQPVYQCSLFGRKVHKAVCTQPIHQCSLHACLICLVHKAGFKQPVHECK